MLTYADVWGGGSKHLCLLACGEVFNLYDALRCFVLRAFFFYTSAYTSIASIASICDSIRQHALIRQAVRRFLPLRAGRGGIFYQQTALTEPYQSLDRALTEPYHSPNRG